MGFIQISSIVLLLSASLVHALKSCYVGQANITGGLQNLSSSSANLSSSFKSTPGNYTVCIAFSLTRNTTVGNQSNVTTDLILDGSTTGSQAECLAFAKENIAYTLNGTNVSTNINPVFKCCNETDDCNKLILGSLSSASPPRIIPSIALGTFALMVSLIGLVSI